ncbi:thioredoxin reductase [Micromonospora olivasterospora]|uniref:Uncharacterized protein n=1 Tax=Micromonospora olivasterospora TaxID=1880 RepID=A0A562I5Q2_MICOL|nr:thioredoxin reductase [Micromonospora olivasterospora]TWH66024.1 hypothetical protein JD77_00968 [Micromonospora olivasterospora]
MRDLRYEMTVALAATDLDGPLRERVVELCAGVAERHCAEAGHVPAVRSGEIGELAGGEPAITWSPTEPQRSPRAG